MAKVLGIDLGTGFSCMAVMEGGEPKVIVNAEGGRTTPSIVAWDAKGERLVGQAAKRQAVTNPKNTVYEIKRFIGRKYDDVLDDIKLVSYDVVKSPNGDCRIKIGDKLYSPEEISSFILQKLKADAEAYLGEKITEAVITVPAYFDDSQRQATKNAGEIAGLKVLRIVNEPTAASLSYGLDKDKKSVVAVADVGAGTFDITILEMADGVFEVKATNGDTRLGGKDYDQAIMQWMIDDFKKDTGIDLQKDQMALQRLKDEAEKAKIALSTSDIYDINIPFISADSTGPKHLAMTLSRPKFESLVSDLNDKLTGPCRNCMTDASEKIDKVVLVGGTTRIPSVQAKIKEIFNLDPSKGVNQDEAVAEGAAIQGGVLKGDVNDILLLDVTPLTLAIETMGGVATPMIERNTTIPAKKTQVFTTASDNQSVVTVRICQGERKMFEDNKFLGTFNLDGIPPAPRGVPQIEITYDIDQNGILNVSAKDLGTSKEQHITITSSGGLSKEEIEKAKKDAELHATEDEKRADLVMQKNALESMCFSIEKSLKDNEGKATDEEKNSIEAAVAEARESLKSDDLDKIKSASESLTKAWEPVIKKIYASSNAGTGNGSVDPEVLKNMFNNAGAADAASSFNAANNSSTAGSTDPSDPEVV